MNNINIFIVRHGQTRANTTDYIGQDITEPLNETGVQQAKLLGKRFADQKLVFDFVHCSTHIRARDTALLALGTDAHINYAKALIEYDPGDLKGKRRSEIYGDLKMAARFVQLNMGFPFPNGETLHQVERRASKWLEDVILYNKEVLALAEERDVNVAVFSHGQTIKALLHYILGFDQSFLWKMRIANTGICKLKYNVDSGWTLYSINDTAHLLGMI